MVGDIKLKGDKMKILSVEQICDKLILKKSTVYLWVRNKKIPHVKINKSIRFNELEIDRWLQTMVVKPYQF